MFDTKIAMVIRDDLATWQRLNVTAFLATGIAGSEPEIIGEPYSDAEAQTYLALSRQPIIVLSAARAAIGPIYRRALDRGVPTALFIDDMFKTGFDAANRATVAQYTADDMPVVGLAFRGPKKVIDKVTKGARLHD